MTTDRHETYDVVGIGFGPSNLSLAIALEERRRTEPADPLTALFLERKAAFGWHRNMILPSAKMQVSFLKDLATFRNPVSRFSFVSYLHAAGRLAHFVNNQDFYPTRQEFHAYLEWAAAQVADRVEYGSAVTGIHVPDTMGREPADHVRVEIRDGARGEDARFVTARNIVISTGLVPKMPEGIEADSRVWHSSEFLARFDQADRGALKRVAVVGAGQSAAEIVRFLYDMLPDADVSAIIPSYGYSIADNTPFANRVFDPSAVDDYYEGTDRSRDAFWRYHRNTNYSVVDAEVLKDLFQRVYNDEVTASPRLNFVNLSRVDGVERIGEQVRVAVHSLTTASTYDLDVDLLVCATGYDSMKPATLLGKLDAYCLRDEEGRYRVDRDYRIVTTPELRCGIYLQGGTEHTHGLSSSLLSNIAVRSGEIADSIAETLTGARVVSRTSPDVELAAV